MLFNKKYLKTIEILLKFVYFAICISTVYLKYNFKSVYLQECSVGTHRSRYKVPTPIYKPIHHHGGLMTI